MASIPLLATELKVFRSHRDEWLREHADAFVAIQGKEVGGFFESYAEAFRAGLVWFGGQQSFLIRQVRQTEPVYFVF